MVKPLPSPSHTTTPLFLISLHCNIHYPLFLTLGPSNKTDLSPLSPNPMFPQRKPFSGSLLLWQDDFWTSLFYIQNVSWLLQFPYHNDSEDGLFPVRKYSIIIHEIFIIIDFSFMTSKFVIIFLILSDIYISSTHNKNSIGRKEIRET